jgi:hypothetical protein
VSPRTQQFWLNWTETKECDSFYRESSISRIWVGMTFEMSIKALLFVFLFHVLSHQCGCVSAFRIRQVDAPEAAFRF